MALSTHDRDKTGSVFDTLKPYLETMFFNAADGEMYVFPKLRLNSNPGTSAKKIVTKSKQELWPNFFNSLRASTLTDLMDQHGLRKACKWAGNSAAVAMKCYALTRSDDFDDNGQQGQETSTKSDAKSDAILPADAKSNAIPASTTEQKPNKKRTVENHGSPQCVSVDDIGLENHAETRGIFNFNSKATRNPTLLSQWVLKTFSSSEIKELISNLEGKTRSGG